jgi:hypothetical protein
MLRKESRSTIPGRVFLVDIAVADVVLPLRRVHACMHAYLSDQGHS